MKLPAIQLLCVEHMFAYINEHVYVRMHIYMYLCMHACMCVYVCMYVCMHACINACMHVCMCVCIRRIRYFIHASANRYVYTYKRVNRCVYYIYTHMNIHGSLHRFLLRSCYIHGGLLSNPEAKDVAWPSQPQQRVQELGLQPRKGWSKLR